MQKKGFTFVELAIVLVIIGIIMGMAIKGKALIDVAKLRSDLRKIEKIEAAVASMIAKTDTNGTPINLVRRNTTGELDNTTFINAGLLTSSDLLIGGTTYTWILSVCAQPAAGATGIATKDNTTNNVCIISAATEVSPFLACNIEVMLDDDNATNGYGRSSLANSALNNFTNCDALSKTASSGYSYKVY